VVVPFRGLPLAALALAAGARAQSLLEWKGVAPNQRLGSVVATVPDTDGDGVEDVLVSSPFLAYAGFQAGAVDLFSGATGAVLVTVGGDAPGDHAGWSAVGLPDLDGDGRGDFAVGAIDADTSVSGTGRVRVHSAPCCSSCTAARPSTAWAGAWRPRATSTATESATCSSAPGARTTSAVASRCARAPTAR
jgi:hypothetical protein